MAIPTPKVGAGSEREEAARPETNRLSAALPSSSLLPLPSALLGTRAKPISLSAATATTRPNEELSATLMSAG